MTKERSVVAKELSRASQENGSNLQMNPRLADVVARAKKMGFPKASIESAIARGQGVSPSGVALENLTIEAMVPPSMAFIIECQTDSKLRTLGEIRLAIKESGGTVTPTNHLFDRKGRVVFQRSSVVKDTEIFDRAIEAGATDVEIDEDDIVVCTEPSQLTAVANTLAQALGSEAKSSDIIWDPKEDMAVDIRSPELFRGFLGTKAGSRYITVADLSTDRIYDDSSVQDVYTNCRTIT